MSMFGEVDVKDIFVMIFFCYASGYGINSLINGYDVLPSFVYKFFQTQLTLQ